ncbi:MAG: FAD-dependent thymidylate synthase [Gemmatales bacterium]|nr:FAD-dependent thymidylate synthase [Gemmatales bacterium]MDW7993925.1 FAD-dependent thymidylate synthase [Gemmatales bacterium]
MTLAQQAPGLPRVGDAEAAPVRIFHEPRVYLLARQTLAEQELERFLTEHGISWESDSEIAAERLVETAGRICYMSFARPRPGGNAAYVRHILEAGHGSVLEHAVWTFLFAGVSRSLTHELVRHRAGFSYSQLSQRYVDESVAEYVEPRVIAEDPELHQLWVETIAKMHQAYVQLAEKLLEKFRHEPDRTLRRKLARQAARSVLPNATETKIVVTANARAWRHFIEMRASRWADVEIRQLAVKVLRILQQEAPHLFGDYELRALPDGTYEAITPYRKV